MSRTRQGRYNPYERRCVNFPNVTRTPIPRSRDMQFPNTMRYQDSGVVDLSIPRSGMVPATRIPVDEKSSQPSETNGPIEVMSEIKETNCGCWEQANPRECWEKDDPRECFLEKEPHRDSCVMKFQGPPGYHICTCDNHFPNCPYGDGWTLFS